MKKVVVVAFAALFAMLATGFLCPDDAEAQLFGRRRCRTSCQPVSYCQPVSNCQPVSYCQPACNAAPVCEPAPVCCEASYGCPTDCCVQDNCCQRRSRCSRRMRRRDSCCCCYETSSVSACGSGCMTAGGSGCMTAGGCGEMGMGVVQPAETIIESPADAPAADAVPEAPAVEDGADKET